MEFNKNKLEGDSIYWSNAVVLSTCAQRRRFCLISDYKRWNSVYFSRKKHKIMTSPNVGEQRPFFFGIPLSVFYFCLLQSMYTFMCIFPSVTHSYSLFFLYKGAINNWIPVCQSIGPKGTGSCVTAVISTQYGGVSFLYWKI